MDTGQCQSWRPADRGPFPRPPFDRTISPWGPALASEVCTDHDAAHHRTVPILFNWSTFKLLDPEADPRGATRIFALHQQVPCPEEPEHEIVSTCCGAGPAEYAPEFCGKCYDATGWELVCDVCAPEGRQVEPAHV